MELGLSAETGSMTLAGDAVSLGHSRIVPQSEGIEINVATLDQVAERLGLEDVRFVKIDVEGHEAEVLEGARATLARQLPILAIEMHGLIRQGVNEEVELILREIGYSHFYGLFIRHKESGNATDRLMRRATPKPLRSERQFAFVPLEKIPELDNRFVIASAKQLFERCISATRDSPRMINRHSLGPQFFRRNDVLG